MQGGGLVADRFEIENVAGRGGMGTVFRARDRATSDLVALKVVDAWHANARFEREAALLARLADPCIVRYVSHGEVGDGRMYLAMEWIEGTPLDTLLSRGPLSIADAIEIGKRLSGALAAAHRLGIVHRDVKPSNVILRGGRAEEAVLVDFGIARATQSSYVMTATGAVIGTPAYMAPEQARGERSVDARADVFSLGCVLFECVCGRSPFLGEHAIAVLAKILLEPAPSARSLNPEVPGALDRLIAAMLEKDPNARPRDAGAVCEQLHALGRGDVVLARRRSAQPAAALGSTEKRFVTVLLARLGDARSQEVDALAPTEELQYAPTDAVAAERATTYGLTLTPLANGAMLGAVVAETAGSDSAERVARCALSMRSAAPGSTIALATGRAIVEGDLPVGDAIDRAAALFAKHQGDGVWMDEATASLLERRFELAHTDGGVKLLAERDFQDQIRIVMGRATPFVGRDRELALLEATFTECASEPVGRAVLVVGAPGLGKSRLQRELVTLLSAREPRPLIWTGLGDSVMQNRPWALVADLLRRALAIRDGDPVEARRETLAARLRDRALGSSANRVMRTLAAIVGAPFDGSEPLEEASVSDALVAFVSAELERGPLLIVLDDVHWADAASLRVFGSLLSRAKEMPLFVLALARPAIDDTHPKLWEGARCQRIVLEPLLRKASATLARSVLGDRPEIDAIVERSEGNPLFVEELTRACSIQGCSPRACACSSDQLDDLPPTIVAATEVRVASLDPDARQVLRAGAVLGRRFWRGAVAHLLGDRVQGLDDHLARLESLEIVAKAPSSSFPDEPEYVFRHVLAREVAYAMLTDADRRLGHTLAAEWLERRNGDAALLAYHRELGGPPAEDASGVESPA